MSIRLGKEIRSLRYSLDLTLEELAERSGLSIGYLSQVERDLKTPSKRALSHISEALGTTPDWFMHVNPALDPFEISHVVRRDHRRSMHFTRSPGIRHLLNGRFLLSPSLEHDLVMALMVLEPGEGGEVDPTVHNGQEVGYVLAGLLDLQIDGRTLQLQKGDSWFLKGRSPHRYVNGGQEQTKLIMVNTPVVMVMR